MSVVCVSASERVSESVCVCVCVVCSSRELLWRQQLFLRAHTDDVITPPPLSGYVLMM